MKTCCGEAGTIPLVSTRLTRRDRIKAWQLRWGWGRMKAIVTPGLYGIGEPDSRSPVLVTANYQLSFDALNELYRRDALAWTAPLRQLGATLLNRVGPARRLLIRRAMGLDRRSPAPGRP